MKTIANIFEGIFDSDDTKMEKIANDEELARITGDPRFAEKFFKNGFGSYQKGVLSISSNTRPRRVQINGSMMLNKLLPNLKKVVSDCRLIICPENDVLLSNLTSRSLAPRIEAPSLDIWAKEIDGLHAVTSRVPGTIPDVTFHCVREITNCTFETPTVYFENLDHNVKCIQTVFKKTKEINIYYGDSNIVRINMDKVIDWYETLKKIGVSYTKFPTNDIDKLQEYCQANGISLAENIVFYPKIEFSDILRSINAPDVREVHVSFDRIQFAFATRKGFKFQPMPESNLYVRITTMDQ